MAIKTTSTGDFPWIQIWPDPNYQWTQGTSGTTVAPNLMDIPLFINGEYITISQALSAIFQLMPVVIPNADHVKKYPMLQQALDEYNAILRKLLASNELKDALNNFRVIEALIKTEKANEKL